MKKIRYKYFIIALLFAGFEVVADSPSPPEGLDCCVDLEANPGDPGYDEYLRCREMEAADEGSYCRGVLPIDDSICILVAGVGGIALASFVIYRGVKHKKNSNVS